MSSGDVAKRGRDAYTFPVPAPDPTPSLYPVGQKRANTWGLHDMLRSALEWTADWYGEYPSRAVTDPVGPSRGKTISEILVKFGHRTDPVIPSSGDFRVARGGTWGTGEMYLQSATRVWIQSSEGRTSGIGSIGFRLVRID